MQRRDFSPGGTYDAPGLHGPAPPATPAPERPAPAPALTVAARGPTITPVPGVTIEPTRLRPELPSDVGGIIAKALERDRAVTAGGFAASEGGTSNLAGRGAEERRRICDDRQASRTHEPPSTRGVPIGSADSSCESQSLPSGPPFAIATA
jgi:hypothetical protein